MTWQTVARQDKDGSLNETHRMKVPNGWLYRTVVAFKGALSVATSFVPEVRLRCDVCSTKIDAPWRPPNGATPPGTVCGYLCAKQAAMRWLGLREKPPEEEEQQEPHDAEAQDGEAASGD